MAAGFVVAIRRYCSQSWLDRGANLMTTLTVHQATPDDVTELARLLDLFDSMGATPEQVAEPYAELTDIYVDAPFRRQGVARALIAHVEAVARARGAGGLVILTGFDNAGAQAAYRASGYADWALAMEKRFSNA
jgi:GNAT superfamily N-acetyltransferase